VRPKRCPPNPWVLAALAQFLKLTRMTGDLIVYQFSRFKVERGDFRNFLVDFSLDQLPTDRRLREMMNSMVFCVDGYDDDEREIYTIPEVRRFYSAFQ
jgi:hypothetical protein